MAVDALNVDLATIEGVDRLYEAVEADGRSVDILMANAGRGLGKAFPDQDFLAARQVIETNVVGPVYLVQQLGRQMRADFSE